MSLSIKKKTYKCTNAINVVIKLQGVGSFDISKEWNSLDWSKQHWIGKSGGGGG